MEARQANDTIELKSVAWVPEANIQPRKTSQARKMRGICTWPRTTSVRSMGSANAACTTPESPRNHHTARPPNSRYSAHPAGSRGPRRAVGGVGR